MSIRTSTNGVQYRFIKGAFLTLLAIALTISVIPFQQVNAQDAYACDELYYGQNDVLFYNPCEDVCASAEQMGTTLKGVDNTEKIWNFYASKGLEPVAIAGIMGNFSQESFFDPAIKQNETLKAIPLAGDGVTGYGLAQWTYKARQKLLFDQMYTAGVSKYLGQGWGAREINKDIPGADLDKLLEVQLNFSWDGDSTKIKDLADKLNSTTSVRGNDGSTVYFHNAYENSSDTAAEIQERVDDAEKILTKFGSLNAVNGGACLSNLQLGGVKTLQDAIPWAKKYVADTKTEYQGTLNVNGTERNDGTNPIYVYLFGHGSGSYCWNAADCGQCVALSGWFVRKQTTDKEFLYQDGGYIVDRYENAGLPTGREPRPFSVFSAKSSSAGHTGVVLGVLENGDVITAEANWGSDGSVVVWQGNIQDRYAGKDLKFAYFDDRLANEAAAAMTASSSPAATASTAPNSTSRGMRIQ